MDFATIGLMLFPAFLIGAAFGMMISLVLAGAGGLKDKWTLAFSGAGSLAGVAVFMFTENWWPPIVGPFILCPALAATSALWAQRR